MNTLKIGVALVYNKMSKKYEFASWHVARMIDRNLDAVLSRTYAYIGETSVECPHGTVTTYNYADMIASTLESEYRLVSAQNERGLYAVWKKVA